jgi:HEAT repeat protein
MIVVMAGLIALSIYATRKPASAHNDDRPPANSGLPVLAASAQPANGDANGSEITLTTLRQTSTSPAYTSSVMGQVARAPLNASAITASGSSLRSVNPRLQTPAARARVAVIDPTARYTEEQLRKQLLDVPEVALDAIRSTAESLVEEARKSGDTPVAGPTALLLDRVDFQGMQFLKGPDCHLGREPAENLQVLSSALHEHIRESIPKEASGAVFLDPIRLSARIENEKERAKWRSPDALPSLLQMLQAENTMVRRLLIDLLSGVDDPRATAALAVRAMVDLAPEVRVAATNALRTRSATDYRDILLGGLRHPWPPVAAHAAQTLVAVRDAGAVAGLIALLEQPAPGLPEPASADDPTLKIREMVRVNHLRNCLLCHPPSFNANDLVRAAIPSPLRPLGVGAAYYAPAELFVHADVTYLRQDFSVMQPVDNPPAGWPAFQRFDYMVRTRTASTADVRRMQEIKERMTREYRSSVLFALRALTGTDAGGEAADWRTVLIDANFPLTLGGPPPGAVREWKQFLPPAATDPGTGRGGRPWTFLPEQQEAMARQLAWLPVAELRKRLFDGAAETRAAAARALALKGDSTLTLDLIFLLGDQESFVAQQARAALYALTGRDDGPNPGYSQVERLQAVAAWLEWWRTSHEAKKSGVQVANK